MDAASALKSKKNNAGLSDLRAGENVLARSVISTGIYWKVGLILLIALVFLLFAYQLSVFLLIVAGIAFGFAHVRKKFLLLVATDQRVLIKSGLLMTDMVQLQYSKIEGVETQTNLLGRLLGYSTLIVSGTGTQFAFIPYCENAVQLRNVINEMLQQRDTVSEEHMEKQARIQAEALAAVLENKDSRPL